MVAPISALNLGFTKINASELKLLATKTVTTEIKQTLASQKLEMDKLEGSLASVTSLVGRLPVFDYHNLNGVCYLRIKKEVDFARSSTGNHLFILSTDDLRLKIVIIPWTDAIKIKGNIADFVQK